MKKLSYKRAALFLLTGLTLASCDPSKMYDHSQKVPDSGWYTDSAVQFSLHMTDTLQAYNFYITVRNNDDYPYRNLYLFFNTSLPNRNITRDTIELILADTDGRWIGKGFGALRDNKILIRRNLMFPLKGVYQFGIEQAMREDCLLGITDVGIRIEYAK
ncbi:MAG: gliding motility lipoprotein GldH [Bacteroidales bacterium]|nr:gliding motility lipoprotein GldH [Bacteroidales bacterium]